MIMMKLTHTIANHRGVKRVNLHVQILLKYRHQHRFQQRLKAITRQFAFITIHEINNHQNG